MKTYNQFVVESYSARENIQEALPLLIPAAITAAKLASMGITAYQAYQAAQKLISEELKTTLKEENIQYVEKKEK